MLRLARPLLAALLWAGLVPVAAAQDAAGLRQWALAATCANCHGTQGRAVADAVVPGLAGMPAPYLIEQMKAFKAGTRPATVMHHLSKGFSDAQIESVAGYFAAQRK
jgi:sulfide dehydrogenase cytochrome subunit